MENLRVDFIVALLDGLIYIIAGWVMFKWPPKSANGYYGYRTPRSMKTQESWDFSQVFSGRLMIKWGVGLLGLAFLSYALVPQSIPEQILLWIVIVMAHLMPIIQTELALKNKF